jgi:hypothetical protein
LISDNRVASKKLNVVTLVTACFFVLQALFVGLSPGGTSYAESIICAQQSDIGSTNPPSAPGAHSHFACCILHSGVLLLPEAGDAIPVKIDLQDASASPVADYSADLPDAAPELGPLSARAPPYFLS